jgi:sec-independent protein translocase protein TatA
VNIFGLGLPEMIVILVVAVLIFGPKKLPEIGRSMGKAIRGFQEASREFESEFKKEAEQLEAAAKRESAVKSAAPSDAASTKEAIASPEETSTGSSGQT